MGGPAWGWFTGWFNLIGLIGVVAGIDYGARDLLGHDLACCRLGHVQRRAARVIHLPVHPRVHTILNIFSVHPLALEQHVASGGTSSAAVIVLILIFGRDHHQCFS